MIMAVAVIAVAALGSGPFRSATQGFGHTAGYPYRTSDGSGFFIHSAQDFGDGSPDYLRPIHASFAEHPDIEWTTYVTQDASGPTRLAGGENNQSDSFYVSHGVYAQDFASRTPTRGTLMWSSLDYTGSYSYQQRMGAIQQGVLRGAYFIAGPAVDSGVAPDGLGSPGLFMARLTVHRGVVVSGAPWSAYVLPGEPNPILTTSLRVDGPEARGLSARAFLVAQLDIADPGIASATGTPFGPADVYDIWVVRTYPLELPSPSGGLMAVIAMIVSTRRHRIARD